MKTKPLLRLVKLTTLFSDKCCEPVRLVLAIVTKISRNLIIYLIEKIYLSVHTKNSPMQKIEIQNIPCIMKQITARIKKKSV